MSNIEFEIHEVQNFSKKEQDKFLSAVSELKDVLNSEEFHSRFLALPLEQTKGQTPRSILGMIKSGADKFNTLEDGDIDIYITMYYSFGRAIGYTYPSTWKTWINRKFFSRFDLASIAGNIFHEYMHNLGFGHKTPSDHNSVPYAAGHLVRLMIREKLEFGKYLTLDESNKIKKKVKSRLSFWGRAKNFIKRIF